MKYIYIYLCRNAKTVVMQTSTNLPYKETVCIYENTNGEVNP